MRWKKWFKERKWFRNIRAIIKTLNKLERKSNKDSGKQRYSKLDYDNDNELIRWSEWKRKIELKQNIFSFVQVIYEQAVSRECDLLYCMSRLILENVIYCTVWAGWF